MAAARSGCSNHIVVNPAAGMFRGSKRELLKVRRVLTLALWLCKPASSCVPEIVCRLGAQLPFGEGERQDASGLGAILRPSYVPRIS